MTYLDDDLRELEGIIDEAIFSSHESIITADLIATAVLAPLELLPELSGLYHETHAVLVDVAKSRLKVFDSAFRYRISSALAIIRKDPDGLRRISAAMQQEINEMDLFIRRKFGDAPVDTP
jgi:hypothetical protein